MTQVIETDEAGRLMLPPGLLGEVKPHSRYTVEVEETSVQRQQVYQEWKKEWDALTEQISASWNTDKSAAEIVAEMRR